MRIQDVRVARGDGGAVFVLVREAQRVAPDTPGSGSPSGTDGFGALFDMCLMRCALRSARYECAL